MQVSTAYRLCATVSRNLLPVPSLETAPPRTLLRRLDAHLRKRVIHHHRQFATSQRWLSEPRSEPVSSGADSSPKYDSSVSEIAVPPVAHAKPQLPQSCPGCGALTQELEPVFAGYYSRSRRVVRQYLKDQKASRALRGTVHFGQNRGAVQDEKYVTEAVPSEFPVDKDASVNTPLCDRCHNLIHNSQGQSIAHPSIEDIADSIAESPFKRNHIYHVVDAADFPMSIIPDIFSQLTLAKPRSQNRRSQHDFSTKPTISFIITRSDLLGSTKEMVDSMMTYFQSVLRQALGRAGRDMRLGNVHLVSAKRGWWTKEIKEEIWKRGGGNWLVGKVNVGKSNLFEVLFPKGSGERVPVYAELCEQQEKGEPNVLQEDTLQEKEIFHEDGLLPPAQPEVPFPVLPIVSSLPGTTASPIRLPFGRHKGELIDMPGLERGDLENYVKQEHKLDLVMTHRQSVEQHIIKVGQSFVLGGGLIRITPQLDDKDRSVTVLAYPFVPLKAHVTSTDKATALQLQQRQRNIESVLAEEASTYMQSAGLFDLTTDVTKNRAGPIIRSGVQVGQLPFCVYATDILIEGLGWIELVCQVRRQPQSYSALRVVEHMKEQSSREDPPSFESGSSSFNPSFAPFTQQSLAKDKEPSLFPRVEVFSPNGKHISQRPCLGAWTRWEDGRKQKDALKLGRPRKSMQGRKSAAS